MSNIFSVYSYYCQLSEKHLNGRNEEAWQMGSWPSWPHWDTLHETGGQGKADWRYSVFRPVTLSDFMCEVQILFSFFAAYVLLQVMTCH